MHEETPMIDDGSVEGDANERIPNIVEEGNSVLTESEDTDHEDQVYSLQVYMINTIFKVLFTEAELALLECDFQAIKKEA